MSLLALGTEDELSEAIGLRLLKDAGYDLQPSPLLRRNGFGYLRSKMDSWCEMAARKPVVLLTDLDRVACPIELRKDWMGNRGTLPPNPDLLPDPKQYLLRLIAKQARRNIREELVAEKGAIASQGIGYNAHLGEWIRTVWRPERAACRSNSLQRARLRIGELIHRLQQHQD